MGQSRNRNSGTYLAKEHQECEDNAPPDGFGRPQLAKGDGETDTGKKHGLQDVRLGAEKVLLKRVHKRGRLIRVRLAVLAVEDHEWRVGVDAGQRAEERAGQEAAVEHRGAGEPGDAEERAEHKDHEEDVGDVLEAGEAVLQVPAEDGAGEVLCRQGGQDAHGDAGDDGTPDEPSEVGVAVLGDGAQVVDDAGHDQAGDIADDGGADEDGADLCLCKVDALGCAADDDKGGAEGGDGQGGADDERLNGAVAEAEEEQRVAEADGHEDANGGSGRAEEEVGLEEAEVDGEATLEDDEDQADVAEAEKGLLPLDGHDVAQRDAVDQADQHLADQAGLEDLIGDPFGQCEEEEEGDDD